MRIITLLFILALTFTKGIAQQPMLASNLEGIIHTGIPGEVHNAAMADEFLNDIRVQTEELVVVRDSIAQLKTELEADLNWESTPEKQAKNAEYQELIDVCDKMLITNGRLLKGYIYIRSID